MTTATLPLPCLEEELHERWEHRPFGKWMAEGPGWSMSVIHRVDAGFYHYHAEDLRYATSGQRPTLVQAQLAAQNALERIRGCFGTRVHPSTVSMHGEAS